MVWQLGTSGRKKKKMGPQFVEAASTWTPKVGNIMAQNT